METYAKQSKPSARTLSARAGHGQPDVATVLQAYRNRTAQLAALTEDDEQALQGKFTTQLQEEEDEALQGKFTTQLQGEEEEEPLQGKFVTQLQSTDEEEPLQGKFPTQLQSTEELVQQKTENRTGLPNQLKAGVESLSGYSLDAVKVHYNSPKPAQLQALAYTQGTDIHVGPGQERHLGHEAWHVVQQMQGRVQPTRQLKGVAVNDNEGLEREADVMGGQSLKISQGEKCKCGVSNNFQIIQGKGIVQMDRSKIVFEPTPEAIEQIYPLQAAKIRKAHEKIMHTIPPSTPPNVIKHMINLRIKVMILFREVAVANANNGATAREVKHFLSQEAGHFTQLGLLYQMLGAHVPKAVIYQSLRAAKGRIS